MLDKCERKRLFSLFDGEEEIVIFRAPAGFGKTMFALEYALKKSLEGKRTGIFFRTIKEVEHALSLYNLVSTREKIKAKILPVVGKRKMCMFAPDEDEIMRWWCQILTCYFLKRRRDEMFTKDVLGNVSLTVSDYYNKAKEYDLCPYFSILELAKNADIVLATHQYVLDDELFSKLGDMDYIFIDEAHNLIVVESAKINVHEYETGLRVDEYRDGREDLYAKLLWESGDKRLAISYARFYKFEKTRGIKIKVGDSLIKILPPRSIIMERLKKVEKIFLISASLYPLKLFEEIFGLRKYNSLSIIIPGMLSGSDNRLIIGAKIGLTTSYRQRNQETYNRYANVLNYLASRLRENIIVFTPSKEFSLKLSEILDKAVLIDNLDDKLSHNYECDGMFFISHMRGAFAEGVEINLGSCTPKISVILGLPYPRIDEKTKVEIRHLSAASGVDAGDLLGAYIQSSMISALVQASGRVGRREKGIVVIIDDRVVSLNIPGIPIVKSINSLINIIKQYIGGLDG